VIVGDGSGDGAAIRTNVTVQAVALKSPPAAAAAASAPSTPSTPLGLLAGLVLGAAAVGMLGGWYLAVRRT
jgi:hypothetical protein